MSNCPKCNASVSEEANYCYRCGEGVNAFARPVSKKSTLLAATFEIVPGAGFLYVRQDRIAAITFLSTIAAFILVEYIALQLFFQGFGSVGISLFGGFRGPDFSQFGAWETIWFWLFVVWYALRIAALAYFVEDNNAKRAGGETQIKDFLVNNLGFKLGNADDNNAPITTERSEEDETAFVSGDGPILGDQKELHNEEAVLEVPLSTGEEKMDSVALIARNLLEVARQREEKEGEPSDL